ncbi:hypothetical protein [Actinomarinicola tropica]|uniref:Uncharacterized protein n=1 Tax=Actinomarinicola tropica TaxID=2789776 RepID=A0A5Q2RHX8_9ACTN|nr:hypothetical protein [Actinomarinicola tropica]QGG96478.1 hypothetical protein GH723_15975 [Actinomarinicola tropica]
MSWHPSRASRQPLDPATPSRYRAATVRSRAGRSLLVETADGHDRLLPVPSAPLPSLVGRTVLLANDYDWVVAVEPSDPVEQVQVDGAVTSALRTDRRLENMQARRHRRRVLPFRAEGR